MMLYRLSHNTEYNREFRVSVLTPFKIYIQAIEDDECVSMCIYVVGRSFAHMSRLIREKHANLIKPNQDDFFFLKVD